MTTIEMIDPAAESATTHDIALVQATIVAALITSFEDAAKRYA